MLRALAINDLPLLIYTCHLLASLLILPKQDTSFNGTELQFFPWKNSVLQTLVLGITVGKCQIGNLTLD